jgi:S1-C subfamily serine protease
VLTSDGWLLSTDAVFTNAVRASLASYRVVVNLTAYPVTDVIVDPYSGVAFLKIDATNLPVTSYSDGADLQAGSQVFAFDVAGGPRSLDVIGYGARPEAAAGDLVRSSERIQRMVRLSGTDGAILSGSMVVDASGEAVAVFVDDDASGSTAVPFAAFSEQIGAVLRDRKAHRPYLGVRYVDTSRVRGVTGFRNETLLAASPDGRPAVQRRSPADDAGLRAGDRIVTVNGEQLGVQTALADLIADYAPGTVVRIGAWRPAASGGGADLDVLVTLGEVP